MSIVGLAAPSASLAQEPGVINPEEMATAAHNTFVDDEYGFSMIKPDRWVVTTEQAVIDRVRAFHGPNVVSQKHLVVASKFPLDAPWLLVHPPAVKVSACRLANPLPATEVSIALEQLANQTLQDAQADPERKVKVMLPPGEVEINGVRWVKFSVRHTEQFSVIGREEPPVEIEMYRESYITMRGDRAFILHFDSRMDEVIESRQDVDRMIQGIVLTEPTSQAEPGTGKEL
jgi:hypothetical protein